MRGSTLIGGWYKKCVGDGEDMGGDDGGELDMED